jgi:hypothetical protein
LAHRLFGSVYRGRSFSGVFVGASLGYLFGNTASFNSGSSCERCLSNGAFRTFLMLAGNRLRFSGTGSLLRGSCFGFA